MEVNIKQWESVLRADSGLQERLKRLDQKGYPATRTGDLLCITVQDEKSLVVSWDGQAISVSQRAAKKPFLSWTISREKFKEVFMGTCPPVLVAMNNDQKNIEAGADHHNGSLVVSLMVILQECMEGGEGR